MKQTSLDIQLRRLLDKIDALAMRAPDAEAVLLMRLRQKLETYGTPFAIPMTSHDYDLLKKVVRA